MQDTIHLWLGLDSISNSNLLIETQTHLTDISEHQNENGYFITGKLGNIKIAIFDSGISIKGSLAKYFFTDNYNFQTLQRNDVQRAFEKMADELHHPVFDARVTRTDLAQNFVVKYNPESYYPYLGTSPYFNRFPTDKSLYYSNGNRTKLFYNKVAESSNKGFDVPEIWQNTNVLRYEYRLTQRAAKGLKMDGLRAKDLYNENVYMFFIDEYIKEYESINKNGIINFNIDTMKSPKDFWFQVALMKIQEIGQNDALVLVEDMRAKGVFEQPEYYSRLKREINQRCKMKSVSESSELIKELNEKIRAVKSNYR